MKNVFLAFALVLASLVSDGQAPKRSFVAFSLIAPTPVGNYRSTDVHNDYALFAKGGMGFGIEGAYMFHPYVGMGAMVAGISNKLDEAEFSDALKQGFKEQQGVLVNSRTKASSHWVQTAMLGVYGSFPLKGISLDAKVLGGLLTYQFPHIQVNSTSGGVEVVQKMNAKSTTNFGLNAGVGARVKLTEHLALRATVEYLQGSADLTIFQSVAAENGSLLATDQQTYPFTISMVNFGIGLAYQINNEK